MKIVNTYFAGLGFPRRKKATGHDIAVMDMRGPIFDQSRISQAPQWKTTLREVGDKGYKALVLRINSPGGSAGTTEVLARQIDRLRDKKGLKVVTAAEDMAASGGFWLAVAPSDWVVANNTSIMGSIGVITKRQSLTPALERLGIRQRTFTAGNSKDKSLDAIIAEEEKARAEGREPKLAQEIEHHLAEVHGMFKNALLEGRQKANTENARRVTAELLDEIADGRIITGQAAEKLGFVDRVGGLDDAIDEAKALIEKGDADVTFLSPKPPSLFRRLIGAGTTEDPGTLLANAAETLFTRATGEPLMAELNGQPLVLYRP